MKKIFSAALALASLTLTSCDDFLTLIPLNEVVAENYWTEKADVESVLYGCYSQMEAEDVIKRMFVWGEVRSDNILASPSASPDLRNIVEEKILQTNGYMKWESFYQVVNRCNTVIENAPIVQAIDPNYDESEMKANIAEATFLRSLSLFYLARTFRDVPYPTKASTNDANIAEDYALEPMPFDQMLSQLISDLEAVKGDALRLYPESVSTGRAANTSRVTNCAIYALLADLYLWKGEYQKCADYCDLVFQYKMERYEELRDEYPDEADLLELWYEKYPLIMETPVGNTQGSAYNAIFGTGNSFESIFELYFQNSQPTKNTMVSGFFGTQSRRQGDLEVYSGLVNGVYDKNDKAVFKPTDCRLPECIEEYNTHQCIRKYANQQCSFSIDPNSTNITAPSNPGTMRSGEWANWIIYRLTDVMLMKAEAEVEMGTPDGLADAFELVSAIYNRANNFNAGSAGVLKFEEYSTQTQMRELVLNERRRELLFEGKRWFDLVRFSLRHNDNTYMVNAVLQKQKDRVSAIEVQLKKKDALFWPYLEAEMDVNTNLIQNEAYITDKTSEK